MHINTYYTLKGLSLGQTMLSLMELPYLITKFKLMFLEHAFKALEALPAMTATAGKIFMRLAYFQAVF
jgi:hypothetical protein